MKIARGMINCPGYSVVCRGVTQGLMLLDLAKYSARLDGQRGEDLVYVEYLEVAPWNWNETYANRPIYKFVGTALMHAAITRSVNEGYNGRVGLHSLPQALSFYEYLGFTNLGTNPKEYDGRLPYCEISPEAAKECLKG